MKIIAVMPLRNEEWVLEYSLKSLPFADEILAINDRSTDGTEEILKKYGATIIALDTSTKIGWKEYDIRMYLLEEARKRNATHIIALDGDEACSAEFQKDAREIFSKLKPGQAIQMEWVNICTPTTYLPPRIYKNFAFCDDGASTHNKSFLHVSRVPETNIEPLLLQDKYCVFHYQCLNPRRSTYKQIWYMMSELIKKNRPAKKINHTYSYVTKGVCVPFEENRTLPDVIPDPSKDNSIWQRDDILKLFNEYGVEYFEDLDIWHVAELKQIFIEKMKRVPVPKKYPKYLIKLNDIKNKIKKLLK